MKDPGAGAKQAFSGSTESVQRSPTHRATSAPAAPATRPGNQAALAGAGLRASVSLAAPSSAEEAVADRAAASYAAGVAIGPASTARTGGQAADAVPLPEAQRARLSASMGASAGAPLPRGLRSSYERFFRADLGSVRVHADAAAAEAARELRASAFAQGERIYFAAQRYRPETLAGRHLLAHELAHTLQPERAPGGGTWLRRAPDGPSTGTPPRPTLDSIVRQSPPGFTDAELDRAYQSYRRGEAQPSDPRTWALHQTTGGPRVRLEALLGADYARGHGGGTVAIDVRQTPVPQGYDPARQAADLQALGADPQALGARLGALGQTTLGEGHISSGHLGILQGNVGELLARPLLQQALTEVQAKDADARLYTGVRARVVGRDGALSDPVAFSDGLIAAVRPAGLQIFRVVEIKSGAEGGVQGAEQIHRWIEKHGSDTVEILLPGVARAFRISDQVREVVGLARAPRLLIAPRGARFVTEQSGHRVAAPVQRLELPQSAEEIAYLTRVMALRMLESVQASRLLAVASQSPALTPGTVQSIAELQSVAVVRRLLAENQGVVIVDGRLYRVSLDGPSMHVRALQARPWAVPLLPSAAGSGGSTPPPGTGPSSASPAGPGPQGLLGSGAPLDLPFTLPPTPVAAHNVLNVSGQDIRIGNRVIPPTVVGETARAGEWIVVGAEGGMRITDANGRDIAAVLEGGRWYRVVAGGRALPVDSEGRVHPGARPIPLTMLEADAAARRPIRSGQPGPPGGPGTGAKAVAGGVGLLLIANEFLAPIGRVLEVQRANIRRGAAEIEFWIRFGANPKFGIWSIGDDAPLPLGAEAETAAFTGNYSLPYVAEIDVESFGRTLPTLIRTHRDLQLFLDLAGAVDAIVEKPRMPQFPSAEERRQPRRYYALVDKPRRGAPVELDVTEIILGIQERTIGALEDEMRARVRGLPEAEQWSVFRLASGSETPLFRSARGGQPILSDEQLLGDDPWVHPLGRKIEGGAWGWFRYGNAEDRVLVEPANADAARATLSSVYQIRSDIDDVLEEVAEGGREILERYPAEGRLEGFLAGPDPEGKRFGETRYYRHPTNPYNWTAAIGELKQFWVKESDLVPVLAPEVLAYRSVPPRPEAAPP